MGRAGRAAAAPGWPLFVSYSSNTLFTNAHMRFPGLEGALRGQGACHGVAGRGCTGVPLSRAPPRMSFSGAVTS